MSSYFVQPQLHCYCVRVDWIMNTRICCPGHCTVVSSLETIAHLSCTTCSRIHQMSLRVCLLTTYIFEKYTSVTQTNSILLSRVHCSYSCNVANLDYISMLNFLQYNFGVSCFPSILCNLVHLLQFCVLQHVKGQGTVQEGSIGSSSECPELEHFISGL
jgi:hypothetical protein